MFVRRERPEDVVAVRAVQAAAFDHGRGEPIEARLLDALRRCDGWIPALSLVAEDEGRIVGHCVSTRGHVGAVACVGLGPIGVDPSVQRSGIGSALVHATIGAADATGEPLIALLGSPAYYSRFGFVRSTTLGIDPPGAAWGEHFQVLPLTWWSASIAGTFRYSAPVRRHQLTPRHRGHVSTSRRVRQETTHHGARDRPQRTDAGDTRRPPMNARLTQPAVALPDVMNALQAFGAAIGTAGLPPRTVGLVNMRASQINGCAVCLEGGIRDARRDGETDDRLVLVSAWRETPNFAPAERAALALCEAVTRLADREDPVPDDVWAEAAEHYDERQLAALVAQIANINLWNRLNVATRQQAGVHKW